MKAICYTIRWALALACAYAPLWSQENVVRQQLQAQYARMARAYMSKDIHALMALSAPDAIARLPDGRILRRAQMAASLKEEWTLIRSVIQQTFTIDKLMVGVQDAVAVVTGKGVTLRADAQGGLHTVEQLNTVRTTWTRTAQGWRIRFTEPLSLTVSVDGKLQREISFVVPPMPEIKRLVTQSLLDWNRAVQKGDFTGFHAGLAFPFREQFSPEKLRDSFRAFADNKIDISSIRDAEPILSPPPSVDADGVLKVSGYYPTSPSKVSFDVKYMLEGGAWRLLGLDVKVK